ncbi:MAG: sugar phosphate isomerase/epimerase [Oscillospiraceae bacterium]|nr:sugar phosphate isomerase/epimerase [Oscillospiraceae bacterium]
MLRPSQLYLSTIDEKASALAAQYGLGLEIAEYCTAWNMDQEFVPTDKIVMDKIDGCRNLVLHAPFNELFPCAIDPKARQLAADRYRQAIGLAKRYGAEKVVVHGGYNPWLYYPVWYVEQSVVFWKEFLQEDPGVQIVLENVLEENPQMLLQILQQVDNPNLKMCLDIGHAHAYSKTPVMQWLDECAQVISHFHIHNNDSSWDTHSPLDQGSIPMDLFLEKAGKLCMDATFTLELPQSASSVNWLAERCVMMQAVCKEARL